MAKLLLTSNGFFTDLIKYQFLRRLEYGLSTISATIITTASQQKEQNRFAIKAKDDFIGMGINRVEFTDIEFESPDKLQKYDVIYINGGNPFYLLHHMKRSGADLILKELSKQNVLIVGVSAGTMVLGPHIEVVRYFTPQMNHVNLEDMRGLGLTDKILFPHYDREDLFPDFFGKTIEQRLKDFEALKKCEVVRMKDEQSIFIRI
ncbi:MAG: Type 1 glutamine amidotransferase-like domain-containing protein [Bacillota bacterium]|nr:Type 1 glutamine amidotransferase-like domain-containing protein [Bacillota bacterium]